MQLTLCYISHAFTQIWLLTFTIIMTGRQKKTCFTSIMSFVAICGPFSTQMHCIRNTTVPFSRLSNLLALTILDLCLTTQRSHRLNKEHSTGDHRCWRAFITIACAKRPGSSLTPEATMWFQALHSCISDAVCTSTWFITSAGNQLVPNQ